MEFEAEVIDLNFLGLGVVKNTEGQVFFAPGVWPGDEGLFESMDEKSKGTKVKVKSFRFAKLKKLLKSSKDRREGFCSYQGFEKNSCGGCPWMIATYDSQLNWKRKILVNQLNRHSIEFPEDFEVLGVEKEKGYRSRAIVRTDGRRLGFQAFQTGELVDIEKCPILNEPCSETLLNLREKLPNSQWSADSEGNFTKIHIDNNDFQIDSDGDFAFRQVNENQNAVLKDRLSELLKEDQPGEILELFSGDGNFTEILASFATGNLTAFDGSKKLVACLNKKSIPRVKAYPLDIYSKKALKKIERSVSEPDTLFLDPPRGGYKGLDKFVSKIKYIRKVIYVSCSSSSFSADISKLQKDNWRLQYLKAIDFFPQTPHLEILGVLTRDL